jgi:hypothetical protein
MTHDRREADLHDEELVAAARLLGVRAAGQLDMDRTARGVVARWRAEQRLAPNAFWKSGAMLRVAAAVVLLVAGIAIWEHEHPKHPQVAVAVVPSDAGLEGLSADQLQGILPAVDQPEDVETTATDAGLEGLSLDELRSVLSQMGS